MERKVENERIHRKTQGCYIDMEEQNSINFIDKVISDEKL